MDDLGQYVKYIIIGLVLAFRLFGRSKKKQQNTNQAPRQNKKPIKPLVTSSSLDDILRELSGEPKRSAEVAVPEPVAKTENNRERKKIDIVDHQYDFRPEYEHHSDTGPSIDTIREDIVEIQDVDEERGESDFDLRQAIIAQTILTRPEY
ncbi:MAG: hypothetical protein COA58_10205 [Bacteroidetes bacterium]|nr:MAG: hypothetical protein COA58_10205 [Bacteroidota bacterium]